MPKKKLDFPTALHKEIAKVATGAARMNRNVAVYADDKMEFRILRAVSNLWPTITVQKQSDVEALRRQVKGLGGVPCA